MRWRDRLAVLFFPKGMLFSVAALGIGLIQLGALTNDVYHFYVTYRFDLMSVNYIWLLLFWQVVGICVAGKGVLYAEVTIAVARRAAQRTSRAPKAQDPAGGSFRLFAWTVLLFNVVAYFGRMTLEFRAYQYRPEEYGEHWFRD
ncbi:cation channel sperm-associated auxiliary subunit TMEM262 [Ctenodactylus gundi]